MKNTSCPSKRQHVTRWVVLSIALVYIAATGCFSDEAATTMALSSIAVTGGVVGLTTSTVKKAKSQSSAEDAKRFLREHAEHLNEDLALGSGPVIEELAAYHSLSPKFLGDFGRALRSQRKDLLALANPAKLTDKRALAFMVRVATLADKRGSQTL